MAQVMAIRVAVEEKLLAKVWTTFKGMTHLPSRGVMILGMMRLD